MKTIKFTSLFLACLLVNTTSAFAYNTSTATIKILGAYPQSTSINSLIRIMNTPQNNTQHIYSDGKLAWKATYQFEYVYFKDVNKMKELYIPADLAERIASHNNFYQLLKYEDEAVASVADFLLMNPNHILTAVDSLVVQPIRFIDDHNQYTVSLSVSEKEHAVLAMANKEDWNSSYKKLLAGFMSKLSLEMAKIQKSNWEADKISSFGDMR